MHTIKRYCRLYKVFIAQFFKKLMQSKGDMLIGLVGFFLSQAGGILFLFLVFRQISHLDNWTFEQLVFMYGFAQIPRGIDHLFTDNLWMVSYWYVVNGAFDRYMLRPANILFQVISETLQPDAIGELAIGMILVIRAVVNHTVTVTFGSVILFLVSVIAGALIYTAVKLFFSALAFWLKISGPFLQVAYNMADFAKYPTEIYSKPVKFIISYIIPFAFVAYLPARYFLTGTGALASIGVEWIIAIVFLGIAYMVFRKGTSIYESAGN